MLMQLKPIEKIEGMQYWWFTSKLVKEEQKAF